MVEKVLPLPLIYNPGLRREDIYIIAKPPDPQGLGSKVNASRMTALAIDRTLARLGLSYVDALVTHHLMNGRVNALAWVYRYGIPVRREYRNFAYRYEKHR